MPETPNNSSDGKAPKPISDSEVRIGRAIIKMMSHSQTFIYKLSNGRLWTTFPGGYPICLITCTGRKSGKKRTFPLIYVPYNSAGESSTEVKNLESVDNVILVASQGGMPINPLWYYNIAANPDIEIFQAGTTRQMTATQVDEKTKAELWPHICSIYPDYDDYQKRTERDIPVFLCQIKKN